MNTRLSRDVWRCLFGCLVVTLGFRWVFALIFDALLLTPLVSAPQWQTVDGDELLLGKGSLKLSAVLFARLDEYSDQASLWLVALVAFALGRISLGSLVFAAFGLHQPPWTLPSLSRARRLWWPFLFIALIGWSVPSIGLVLLWLLLPTLGSFLLPLVGERSTDVIELAVVVLGLLLSLGLSFLLELTRAELAFHSSGRGAFERAVERARTAPLRLACITLPRLFVGVLVLLVAMDFAFVTQVHASSNGRAWIGIALAELAAFVASWCHLDWLRVLHNQDRPNTLGEITKTRGVGTESPLEHRPV